MPRRRRVHIDGLPLHIVQRGHNREPCFFVDADFLAYLHWLKGALRDPASYRWSSYLANGHGHHNGLLTRNSLYLKLGATDLDRQAAYRRLFRAELGGDAIDDVRLALDRDQPLGSGRFHAAVEHMLGRRYFAQPRGRPRRAAIDVAEN